MLQRGQALSWPGGRGQRSPGAADVRAGDDGDHTAGVDDTARRSGAGWDLVVATQRGDRDAFGRLYDRYVGVVFGFVLCRVGERRLAEDLTSETFLRALRGIGSVREREGRDVQAWLITIARNLVLDHVRSSRYRLERPTAELADTGTDELGPEQVVLSKATTAELMRCVARLDPGQRECVLLRFIQGLSIAQTAAVMGRRQGAIRALQHRALRTLASLSSGVLVR